MPIQIREKDDTVFVKFSEQVTIQNIDSIAHKLQSVLETKSKMYVVDATGLTKVDSTFFQLLVSLFYSIKQKGHALEFVELEANHPVMETERLLGIYLSKKIPIRKEHS